MSDSAEFTPPLTAARDISKFVRSFAAEEVVFAQGTRGASMFIVVAGSVRIEDRSGPAPRLIARRGTGEFFGELALVDSGIRSASAIAAETPTRLAEIDRARFMYLVSQQPAFSLAIIRELGRRLAIADRI